MATLAPNLARARTAITRAWPNLTVYWLGDAAHAAERSDHNPDARGIVHAIDVMAAAGTEEANAIVHAAVGRADLQYVIHNRTIWSRTVGWAPRPYTGSNPHTDHVHISGKHGTVGETAHTEAGYDVAAENNTDPWVLALGQTTGGTMATDLTRAAVLAGDLDGGDNVLHARLRLAEDADDQLANAQPFAHQIPRVPGRKQLGEKLDALAARLDEIATATVPTAAEIAAELIKQLGAKA